MAVEAASGDNDAARRTQEHFGQSFVDGAKEMAEATPGLGQAIAGVCYSIGDYDRANQAMESATRTGVIIGGGIGGGPAGALGAGVAYDAAATGFNSVVHGKFKAHGATFHAGQNIAEGHFTSGDAFDTFVSVASDGMTGHGSTKAKQSFCEAKPHYHDRIHRNQAKQHLQEKLPDHLSNKEKHTIVHNIDKAGEHMCTLNPDKGSHVLTHMHDEHGHVGEGYNKRFRQQERHKGYERGEYPSKGAAARDPLSLPKEHPQHQPSRLIHNKPHIQPIVVDKFGNMRNLVTCAEHDAAAKL